MKFLSVSLFKLGGLLLIPGMIALVAYSSAWASSSIAQSYKADNPDTIVAGALVSTTSSDPQRIELTTIESVTRMIGIVDNNPLVTISKNSQNIQVVVSGTTELLVSDLGGPIKSGDKITASPIAGIGMLATADSQIVGTAQASFDTATSQTQTITDRNNKSHTVHIGHIPIQVGVAYYQAPGSNFLPPFVQRLANSLAGRAVSLIRILLASAILFVGFMSIGVLIYSSVRSTITAIGRNPLAAGIIRKGLYQISGIILLILAGTLLGSYIMLIV